MIAIFIKDGRQKLQSFASQGKKFSESIIYPEILAQSVERLSSISYDKFKFNWCSCLGVVMQR